MLAVLLAARLMEEGDPLPVRGSLPRKHPVQGRIPGDGCSCVTKSNTSHIVYTYGTVHPESGEFNLPALHSAFQVWSLSTGNRFRIRERQNSSLVEVQVVVEYQRQSYCLTEETEHSTMMGDFLLSVGCRAE